VFCKVVTTLQVVPALQVLSSSAAVAQHQAAAGTTVLPIVLIEECICTSAVIPYWLINLCSPAPLMLLLLLL
jgi:hypothetical protein